MHRLGYLLAGKDKEFSSDTIHRDNLCAITLLVAVSLASHVSRNRDSLVHLVNYE